MGRAARRGWLAVVLAAGATAAVAQGNPNCPPPVLPGGVVPRNWSCPTGTQARPSGGLGAPSLPSVGGNVPGRTGTGIGDCSPPRLPDGTIPKNWSCRTGTQGVEGNPSCPPPVLPGGVVPKNWSCPTGTRVAPVAPALRHVFHYYYLNGINTPLDGRGRGNYRWDWRMIKANLLDQGARVGDVPQVGAGYREPIRVGDETDVFADETHNPSGTDRLTEAWVRDFCRSVRADPKVRPPSPALAACQTASFIDDVRAGAYTGHMALGDLLECARQAMNFDVAMFTSGPGPLSGIDFSRQVGVVRQVADLILEVYRREQQQPAGGTRIVNHFIVIGHSQGNFMTEGVAYRLRQSGAAGRAVYDRRLGILSLASPTSYNALDDSFRLSRIGHYTRHDDAIVALGELANVGGKSPWKPNVAALWPWPAGGLGSLIGDLKLGPVNPDPARRDPPGQRYCNCPSPDDALYIPRMNSHLIDNYLTDPPLTEPSRPIDPRAAAIMLGVDRGNRLLRDGYSPARPAVLADVRRGLRSLKQDMLRRY